MSVQVRNFSLLQGQIRVLIFQFICIIVANAPVLIFNDIIVAVCYCFAFIIIFCCYLFIKVGSPKVANSSTKHFFNGQGSILSSSTAIFIQCAISHCFFDPYILQ